jgi:hypothetical protein
MLIDLRPKINYFFNILLFRMEKLFSNDLTYGALRKFQTFLKLSCRFPNGKKEEINKKATGTGRSL